MAFDYKKEYKEFYMPSKKPAIVTIPQLCQRTSDKVGMSHSNFVWKL